MSKYLEDTELIERREVETQPSDRYYIFPPHINVGILIGLRAITDETERGVLKWARAICKTPELPFCRYATDYIPNVLKLKDNPSRSR